MKKKTLRFFLLVSIAGMLVLSALNFLAGRASAVPAIIPSTVDVEGFWVTDPSCPQGWTCLQSSVVRCWCAGKWRGCCIP